MGKTNADIVREFYEIVYNQKQHDRLGEFFAANWRWEGFPYVGMGVRSDDTSGKIMITEVFSNGPSDGKLQVGDEILSVEDEQKVYDTFDKLRYGAWGGGILGSARRLRVLRDGKHVDAEISLGIIEPLPAQQTIADFKQMLEDPSRPYPDGKIKVNQVISEGDRVAICFTFTGTHSHYHRPVLFNGIEMVTFVDGKITAFLAISDDYAEYKQLGYTMSEPAEE
jgi:predicted ester cyclase